MINPKILQVQQIDFVTLLNEIDIVIENRLKSFMSIPSTQADAEEFLTREDVAKLLKISKVSLWDWTKKGLLKSYKIGGKVRYKRHEVMSSPKAVNASVEGLKHGKI